MKLVYFGSGYVGQVNAAVQASKGHDVVLIDIDKRIVDSINSGKPTIYENGLLELIKEVVAAGKLKATLDYKSAVKDAEVIFICVGTPSNPDGTIGLDAIKSVSKNIGLGLEDCDDFKVVVVKSTVLPWVPEEVVAKIIKEQVSKRFGLCMNPEFLREGLAVNDCFSPDSIVIGGDSKSIEIVKKVYSWSPVKPSVTGIHEASLVKYATNSFLATKVSFANMIANYCGERGINAKEVLRIMAEDERINPKFLRNGPGFGGSCFPKDVKALLSDISDGGILKTVLGINEGQYKRMIVLAESVTKLDGVIAVLGLSFKPDTDDVRESPSIKLVNDLIAKGLEVRVYDPEALENALKELKDVIPCKSVEDCVNGASLVFIPVPWEEFKSVRKFTQAPIIQGHPLIEGEGVFTLGVHKS